MPRVFDIEFRTYAGPSLDAPFPAVVAHFATPAPDFDPQSPALARVPPRLRERIDFGTAAQPFEHFAALLARALHEYHGTLDLPWGVHRDGGQCRIALGYLDATAATTALRLAVELAAAVVQEDAGALARLVRPLALGVAALRRRQPDPLARLLIEVARRRGIPVAPVALGRLWLFGQGAAGRHLFEVASEDDSLTGARLAGDKYWSNELVRRLGLPGVSHRLAPTLESARAAAAQLGFPLVVKPLRGGQGRDVHTGITSLTELETLWRRVNRRARGQVLVEREVPGDSYRLAVIGGRLCWTVRQRVPHVIGDGRRTVAELVAEDHAGRDALAVAEHRQGVPELDLDMAGLLARQGLDFAARPAAGRVVRLRDVSNTTRGGHAEDVADRVHPDNVLLAETLARAARLAACGIDYVTTDISRSWRDVGGAVLEINATPGYTHRERPRAILERYFPGASDGRLPSVLVVDGDERLLAAVERSLASRGHRVGRASQEHCRLAGLERAAPGTGLAERVLALVHDPACTALVIASGRAELARHGLPLDRIDLAVVAGPPLAAPLAELLHGAVTERLPAGPVPGMGTHLAAHLDSALQRLCAARTMAG